MNNNNNKIKVSGKIVELDGDEMSHIMFQLVKEQLITPYLDLQTLYFDLSLPSRISCSDSQLAHAILAIQQHEVAIKCSTSNHPRM